MTLRGARQAVVREAIHTGDPLPGTAGFAGRIDDQLVRDVLGREPLFVEATGDGWSFDPTSLETPESVQPGHVGDPSSGWDHRFQLPAATPASPERARATLADALETIPDRVPTGELALGFSGGVDSTLLAALLPEATLYAVGFPDSHDLAAARSAAAALERPLETIVLDVETLESAVPETARAIGRTNAMDLAIALGLGILAERVAADGHDHLVLGQGADELFGGYEKVADLDHRLEAETVRDAVREVTHSLPDQLERDVLTVRSGGPEPVFPYLHDAIVEASLSLPEALLVTADTRKHGLREVAECHLPGDLAWRDKKAMQYGSLVARELDRLARQAGYKRRMDEHVDRYVTSRL